MKRIQKIRNNLRDVRLAHLLQLLLDAGFGERQPKGGSSHVIFYHLENRDKLESFVVG